MPGSFLNQSPAASTSRGSRVRVSRSLSAPTSPAVAPAVVGMTSWQPCCNAGKVARVSHGLTGPAGDVQGPARTWPPNGCPSRPGARPWLVVRRGTMSSIGFTHR